MANQQALKSKIRSIEAIMKITNAMKLIATAKLSKQRNLMERNREYANSFDQIIQRIISNLEEKNNRYLVANESDKSLFIIFSSDLGLCGGYNINMIKLLESEISDFDEVVVYGTRGYNMLKNRGINSAFMNKSDNLNEGDFKGLVSEIIQGYDKGQYRRVCLIYTDFINTVTFKPAIKQLLPVEVIVKEVNSNNNSIMEFEPKEEELLGKSISMYLNLSLYSYALQTKVSEQASRRFAMENATDNAQELKEDYRLKYNQARQAAITQEISEIVGGANAL